VSQYEVIYANKYRLGDFVKNITIEDNLGEISFRAVITLEYDESLPSFSLGERIRISGTPYGMSEMKPILYYGILWDIESDWKGHKELILTVYDLSIYLKSEEEFLFQANTTASSRFKAYMRVTSLPLSTVEDTKIKLSKALYRAKPIYEMIRDDLKETVLKGGDFYRVYMSTQGMELRKIGQNKDVYVFETDKNIENITQKRTIEGAVTRVKILGLAENDQLSPIKKVLDGDIQIGVIQKMIQEEVEQAEKSSENSEEYKKALQEQIIALDQAGKFDEAKKLLQKLAGTEKSTAGIEEQIAKMDQEGKYDDLIGLLQKISKSGTKDPSTIKKTKDMTDVAKNMLQGPSEDFTFTTVDINTIRAGDIIRLNNMELYVCSVRHELGDTGRMTITAGSKDYVKRSFYI